MAMERPLPRLAVAGAAVLLVTGIAASPAQASPSAAAKTLAGLKYMWGLKSHAQQAAQCRVWTANRTIAISTAVQAIALVPAGSHLTRAETRSVATRYLTWACSGPGGTPR